MSDAVFACSPRLRIRHLDSGDCAFYCALFTDATLMAWIARPLTYRQAEKSFQATLRGSLERDEVSHWYRGVSESDRPEFVAVPWQSIRGPVRCLRLVATHKDDGRCIALYGVDAWDEASNDWELGVIAPPNEQGNGLATEGMAAIIDALFEQGAARILMRCSADNHRAARVPERLGFKQMRVRTGEGASIWWGRCGPVRVRQTGGES